MAFGYTRRSTPRTISTMPTARAVFLRRFPASRFPTIARTPSTMRNRATIIMSSVVIVPVATTSSNPITARTAPSASLIVSLDLTPRLT